MKTQALLTSAAFFERQGGALEAIERATGTRLERIAVPLEGRLDRELVDRIEIAFFSADLIGGPGARRFYGVARLAPRLRWLHVAHAGIDDPIYHEMLGRGVRITTSSGDAAGPIAQSAIAGLLMLARGFPRWLEAQRRHEWAPHPGDRLPSDLEGQIMLVVGVGAIGNEIARLARALGLRVIGLRRSPGREGDHVDELHPPGELRRLAAAADWLAIACPLTDETRGLVSSDVLDALPAGAHVINVARGEIVDEPALIERLRDGRLGGAYLDVFAEEPLAASSPLWDLPNAILSPHNSAASRGNLRRTEERYLRNLEHWLRGEPLEQEAGLA